MKPAEAVAKELLFYLAAASQRIEVAGSLRRRKPLVGDVEIVYVPAYERTTEPGALFPEIKMRNSFDATLESLIKRGVIEKRSNIKGSLTWGEKNKLARHVASGLPVDFFATEEDAWFNYLVCRTGGAQNNIAIAKAAQRKGWQWNPYSAGFSRGPDRHGVLSEQEVFEFVGLPYLAPEDRC